MPISSRRHRRIQHMREVLGVSKQKACRMPALALTCMATPSRTAGLGTSQLQSDIALSNMTIQPAGSLIIVL